MFKSLTIILSSPYDSFKDCGPFLIFVSKHTNEDVQILVSNEVMDTFKYDPKGSVRELMVKFHSGDTQTVNLDLNNNYIQTVTVDDVEYSIQLMNIGTENFDGKDYPKFEFLIESSTP